METPSFRHFYPKPSPLLITAYGHIKKTTFCKTLYKYDDSSDNSEDVDELAARLRSARKRSSKPPPKPPIRPNPAPERSSTFPDYPVSGRQKGAEDMATSTSPEQTSGILRPLTPAQEARKGELEESLEEAKKKASRLWAQKQRIEQEILGVKEEISEIVRPSCYDSLTRENTWRQ
ncbi:hypothetical protein FQN50_008681 [Emmonsiellopsis sp. PD_5]|nr:hypothetical protein FQN50_008681 [Emmonsiellopsis sp. PD_5]